MRHASLFISSADAWRRTTQSKRSDSAESSIFMVRGFLPGQRVDDGTRTPRLCRACTHAKFILTRISIIHFPPTQNILLTAAQCNGGPSLRRRMLFPSGPHCPRGQCVAAKTQDFLSVLRDPTARSAAKAEALKFVVHFAGDLHQPLHDEDIRQPTSRRALPLCGSRRGRVKLLTCEL